MTNTFRALSALLSYPTAELKSAAGEIQSLILGEGLAPADVAQRLDKLIADLKGLDLYELQERYVFLFDRTKSLSLYLFEHVHGESRDRGQAMVDLKSLYAEGGLEIEASELPDYLPLFLEYLSTRPVAEARALLGEPLAVIAALNERLVIRETPYAAVFSTLMSIAGTAPVKEVLEELLRAPDDDPNDLEALDAAWESPPVTFGPTDDGCPKVDEMLGRMQTTADKPSMPSGTK
jgi:nitrate reductase delta subunit